MSAAQLFDVVLSGILDNLTPTLNKWFNDLSKRVDDPKVKSYQIDYIFDRLFSAFPSHIMNYDSIINTITSFAETAPNEILLLLISKFKKEVLRKVGEPFSMIQITSVNFNPINPMNFYYLKFFTLFVLTDLISKIVNKIAMLKKFSKQTPIGKLVPCGFLLCTPLQDYTKVQERIIRKWSFIFHKISQYDASDITIAFGQYANDANAKNVLNLISRVSCSSSLIDSLLLFLTQARKARILTAEHLHLATYLISHNEMTPELLQEYFNFAWSYRSTDGIKEGAVIMLSSLFTQISAEKKRAEPFFQTRIFKHTTDPKKLLRSAEAFLFLLRGNTGETEFSSYLPCEYAGCKGIIEHAATDFVKYFMGKADFSVCPQKITAIVVQIASFDMTGFCSLILPGLLNQSDSCRSIALSAIAEINDPQFIERATSPGLREGIEKSNSMVREIVVGQLSALPGIVKNAKLTILNVTTNHSKVVQQFITENNLVMTKISDDLGTVVLSQSWTPIIGVLKAMPAVLKEEDLQDGLAAQILLYMSVSPDVRMHPMATAAIHKLFGNEKTQHIIIKACFDILHDTHTAEIVSCCLIVLKDMISNLKYDIKGETIREMESYCFLSLTSESATTRGFALDLLWKIGELFETPLVTLFRSKRDEIRNEVCILLVLQDIPETPQKVKTITNAPRLEEVARSDYFDLCTYYASAVFSNLIDEGYEEYMIRAREGAYEFAVRKQRGTVAVLFYLNTFVNEGLEVTRKAALEILEKNPDGLISAIPFLHYKVVKGVFFSLASTPDSLLKKLGPAVARLIQNPSVFSQVIFDIFGLILEFLLKLQNHFAAIGVNSPKAVLWNEETIQKLKENEDLAISYCIIVAAVFNNISDQVGEEDWPVSARQVTASFLIHWTESPSDEFKRISDFAVNALIPLLTIGTVFRDGFDFDPQLLDRLVPVQIDGYPVLDSLLLYHVDILAGEFVKQAFLRNRRESNLFVNALLTSLEQHMESGFLKSHVGALLILAKILEKQRIDDSKLILNVLFHLFMSKQSNNTDVIEQAENLDFITTMFEFATEQVIEFGLNLIKVTRNSNTVRFISQLILPWFDKIRILPTHPRIANVPAQFCVFNVTSFMIFMVEISSTLSEEAFDLFAEVWYALARQADNSKVIFLLLFEIEDVSLKQRIFNRLCSYLPGNVMKFLTKRFNFAFWYYLKNIGKDFNSVQSWLKPIFIHAFTEHSTESVPFFTTVMNTSLLYHENASQLLDVLYGVVDPDVYDAISQLGLDGPLTNDRIFEIVQIIAGYFEERENLGAIDKWTAEATRWAVCCSDIKVALRAMVILNALGGQVEPYFRALAKEAVLYFLDNSDDYSLLAPYMAELFKIIGAQAGHPQFSGFAIEFASTFVNFVPLQKEAFRSALPLLLQVVNDPMADKARAHSLLVDSFSSFACDIEDNPESVYALKQLIETVGAPELELIGSVLARDEVIIEGFNKSYEECLQRVTETSSANKAMTFLSQIISGASEHMMASLFGCAADILGRFRDNLNPNVLIPITQAAVSKILSIKEAARFIGRIAEIDPAVAALEYDDREGTKSLDEVITGISDIKVEVAERAPISNCKVLESMAGMIGNRQPPLIYPYVPQAEIVAALREMAESGDMRTSIKRWNSKLMTGRVAATKSIVFGALPSGVELDEVSELSIPPTLRMQFLDLPTGADDRYHVIASDADFLAAKG